MGDGEGMYICTVHIHRSNVPRDADAGTCLMV